MNSRPEGVDHTGGRTNYSSSTSKETNNPQNVAQVSQLSPTSFPLSHLQELAQKQPVELSWQCFVNVEWTELALAMVMDTLSPMRGCFARGSVVSLSCVGFDTGPNAGKGCFPIPLLAVTGRQLVFVRHAQSVKLDVSRQLLKEESSA